MRIVVISLVLMLVAVCLGPAQAAPELMLYTGDVAIDQGGIKLESWGSGFAAESYDTHYVGTHVLKVLSQGYYQGAVLAFKRPLSMESFAIDPNAYIELWVKPGVTPTKAPRGFNPRGLGPGAGASGAGLNSLIGGSASGRGSRGGGGASGRGSRGGGSSLTMPGGRGGAGMVGGLPSGAATRGGGAAVSGRTGSGMEAIGGGRGGGRLGGRRGGDAVTSAGAPGGSSAGNVTPGAGSVEGAAIPAGGQSTKPTPEKKQFILHRLRLILLTDKGELLIDAWPLIPGTLNSAGWRRVDIPLAAFKSSGAERGEILRGLRISSDRADMFYIGQIKLVQESSPIELKITAKPVQEKTAMKAEAGAAPPAETAPKPPATLKVEGVESINAKVGEGIKFHAAVDAGPALARISWDFDGKDGIQVEAEGKNVEWIYEKSGVYTVTCTATDLYGSKKQVTSTLKVIVSGISKSRPGAGSDEMPADKI